MTRVAFTLVILLAPFTVSAQSADAPAVCAQPAAADAVLAPPAMDRDVGRTLKRAARAHNARDYARARALVGQTELDQLTPYELAMAEGVLFRVADAERKYDEARAHLVRAIESCGLSGRCQPDLLTANLAPQLQRWHGHQHEQ